MQASEDIETVRALSGHYSIVVTQRHTRSNNETKQRTVELLGPESRTVPAEIGANLLQIGDKSETETRAMSSTATKTMTFRTMTPPNEKARACEGRGAVSMPSLMKLG
jgi:hypothetical protein